MSGKKKQDQPTARERRLVQGVLSGQPVKQAASAAGYAPSSASSNAYVILDRPRVRSLLTDALERAGLSEGTLCTALLAALNARVQIVNTRTMAALEVDLPDHQVRLAAVDKIVALYAYVPRRVEMPDPPGEGLTVNICQQQELKSVSAVKDQSASDDQPVEDHHSSMARCRDK
jgi:phage terminase small subunit